MVSNIEKSVKNSFNNITKSIKNIKSVAGGKVNKWYSNIFEILKVIFSR